MTRPLKPVTDLDPFEQWLDSSECLEAARDWALDDGNALDAYLATRQSDDDYRAWCADTAAEGNAERRRLAGDR